MIPKDILNQWVEGINFPYAPGAIEAIPEGSYCRLAEHVLLQTKPYRDEGCATYKLIKFLQEAIPADVKEIWWRSQPKVHRLMDFDRKVYPCFVGRVRFSVFTDTMSGGINEHRNRGERDKCLKTSGKLSCVTGGTAMLS